tara:strand:+ start:84 stop:239 length:156 start_codon:yes stop_codon:yes gene_type:complete
LVNFKKRKYRYFGLERLYWLDFKKEILTDKYLNILQNIFFREEVQGEKDEQ